MRPPSNDPAKLRAGSFDFLPRTQKMPARQLEHLVRRSSSWAQNRARFETTNVLVVPLLVLRAALILFYFVTSRPGDLALTKTAQLYYPAVSKGKGRPIMRAAAVLTLLLATVALNGCSTMASVCMDNPVDGGKRPYGGTTRCVQAMKWTLFDDEFIAIPNSRPICFAFQVCDLPLSLAADTVALPFTVPYTLTKSFQPSAYEQLSREELGQPSPPSRLATNQ